MTATIEVDDWTATVEDGVWTVQIAGASKQSLQVAANALKVLAWNPEPQNYDPNPDLSDARMVAGMLDGKVVSFTETTPAEKDKVLTDY